jgi:hypothetical protein
LTIRDIALNSIKTTYPKMVTGGIREWFGCKQIPGIGIDQGYSACMVHQDVEKAMYILLSVQLERGHWFGDSLGSPDILAHVSAYDRGRLSCQDVPRSFIIAIPNGGHA